MRKVALTSLFLIMFNINGQNSDVFSKELTPTDKERISIRRVIEQIHYTNSENRSNGLNWSENVPVFSPIKIENIKYISDYFGMRKSHPVLHIPKFHFGIDFCANIGTTVHSTANGIVEKIQYKRYGYGNNIIINHGDGYKTRYAHLNEIFVKEGDIVKLDNIIGTVGSTGMSTGNHLHYEVIFNNTPIDPLSFYFANVAVNKNSNDYVNILTELERIKSFLINNNSLWTEFSVISQNQSKT